MWTSIRGALAAQNGEIIEISLISRSYLPIITRYAANYSQNHLVYAHLAPTEPVGDEYILYTL